MDHSNVKNVEDHEVASDDNNSPYKRQRSTTSSSGSSSTFSATPSDLNVPMSAYGINPSMYAAMYQRQAPNAVKKEPVGPTLANAPYAINAMAFQQSATMMNSAIPNFLSRSDQTSTNIPYYPYMPSQLPASYNHVSSGFEAPNNSSASNSKTGFQEGKSFWKTQPRSDEPIATQKLSPKVTSPLCPNCSKTIGDEPVLEFGQKMYHDYCFVCFECQVPLTHSTYAEKNGLPYCEKCERDRSVTKDPNDPSWYQWEKSVDSNLQGIKLKVRLQPELYQIANYNVYPAPEIFFEEELPCDVTIYANLVENETHSVVPQGFQTETIREMRTGAQMKTFAGLKLSKKGVIKNFLKEKSLKPKNMTFCIRFTIGSKCWHSRSFKILSSCSQLPPHLRDSIRPFAVSAPSSASPPANHNNHNNQHTTPNIPANVQYPMHMMGHPSHPMMMPDQYIQMFPGYLQAGPADFAHFASNAMAINFVMGDRKPQSMDNYKPQMPTSMAPQSTPNQPAKHASSIAADEDDEEEPDEQSKRRVKRKSSSRAKP